LAGVLFVVSGFYAGSAYVVVGTGQSRCYDNGSEIAPPETGQQAPGGSGTCQLRDVHGAGAQRSDPKVGTPAQFPHGRGPQGDVIRFNNVVRLLRGGDVK